MPLSGPHAEGLSDAQGFRSTQALQLVQPPSISVGRLDEDDEELLELDAIDPSAVRNTTTSSAAFPPPHVPSGPQLLSS